MPKPQPKIVSEGYEQPNIQQVEQQVPGQQLPQTPAPIQVEARRLAEAHQAALQSTLQPPSPRPLIAYLDHYEQLLDQAIHRFRTTPDQEISLSYAAEWILDNSYVVKQALREIDQDMPSHYYRQLPLLNEGELAGYPRAYAVARAFLAYEKDLLAEQRLLEFIQAYQQVSPLRTGELWALPTMLRLVMIESLILSVSRITRIELKPEELPPTIVDYTGVLTDDQVVANGIISLRSAAVEDWKTFFEQTSLVEWALNQDPAGVYALMDFETRDAYRKVVEEIALQAGLSELEVARQALQLAQDHLEQAPVGETPPWLVEKPSHVGYYLVSEGRRQLESCLNLQLDGPHRLTRWFLAHPTLLYLGSILGITMIFLAGLGLAASLWQDRLLIALLGFILLLLPALSLAVDLVNWVATNTIKPRLLPKLNFEQGVPAGCSTLIVIPTLLSKPGEVEGLVHQLELHYLRNPQPNLFFALLTDFPDAPEQTLPEDRNLLKLAEDGVNQLNDRYGREAGGRFFLFHRERRWNPSEAAWMGWERKRGKLHDLNHFLLTGERGTFTSLEGPLEALHSVRYVITLDADTVLPRQSAARLAATLAHPLNRAEFDSQGRVCSGYTILQPRTEIDPSSANQSLFSRIYSGDTGLDLYTRAISDVYQDLFGEGSYVGKGIYDVAAFEHSLQGLIPENTLLSHDLLEGSLGRAGLVTDISLVEDFPANYLVYALRANRWIRGDWQLLPWLLSFLTSQGSAYHQASQKLSLIDRWKIVDNLRRSLAAPWLLLLLISGWTWLPGSPLLWTLFALLTLAAPLLTGFAGSVLQSFQGKPTLQVLHPHRLAFFRWLLAVVFLPYEALLHIEAVITTLVRVSVTRRHLLRWTTSAQAALAVGVNLTTQALYGQMLASVILVIAIALLVGTTNLGAILIAAPLLVVWAASPRIAYWLSQPVRIQETPLNQDDQRLLRNLAIRTWLFFERFVGPEDHWLPPDHFQEAPLGIVAHRTSPTNIGMLLLSTLAAYDMGYIGLLDFSARLTSLFDTLYQLERYRGHFLNWYDTRSLEPLNPRYVSTVDSGNLAGALIGLAQACQQMPSQPLVRPEPWQAFIDLAGLVRDVLAKIDIAEISAPIDPILKALDRLQEGAMLVAVQPQDWPVGLVDLTSDDWQALDRSVANLVTTSGSLLSPTLLEELRLYVRRLHSQVENLVREYNLLLPWQKLLASAPGLFQDPTSPQATRQAWIQLQTALKSHLNLNDLARVRQQAGHAITNLSESLPQLNASAADREKAQAWLQQIQAALQSADVTFKSLVIGLQQIQARSQAYIQQMEFGFLFNPQREVFHIGYNLSLGKLDVNYYDLLASESRLASLIAIAKEDVPLEHWLHLARPVTVVDHTRALLSWSATMFEYLMPDLLVRSYQGTLLHSTSEAVVKRQIEYGQSKKVPWGISESGYYRFDPNMFYQYRAFGVPGLGYKRGLGDDLVITPYASLLAIPYQANAVAENAHALIQLGMLGTYGFYESVDFTPARVHLGDKYEIVREFMSHHQGMILVALANYFTGDCMVQRFHQDARIQAVNLLLQEMIPHSAPIEKPHTDSGRLPPPQETRVAITPWRVRPQTPQPRVHAITNGRYKVLMTAGGGGLSAWKDIDLTRWRADTTLSNWGTWIYLKDNENGALWSVGYQPTGIPTGSREIFFSAHMVELRRRDYDIAVAMEVTVSPEDDLEIRRISLTNHSNRLRKISLASYGEVVMATQAADSRHPAFSKMFIESEYDPQQHLLIFHRRLRGPDEKPAFMGHALVGLGDLGKLAYESDREKFLGRGQTTRHPRALLSSPGVLGLTGTTGGTLDPIFSLGVDLVLQPHQTVQFAFLTIAADSVAKVREMASRYHAWHVIEKTFDQARLAAEVELRQLGLDTPQLQQVERLLSVVLYPSPALRAAPEVLAANTKGQPGLWAFGISGDYPILLLKIKDVDGLPVLRELLQAHAYWRNRQIKVDLVILNEQGTGYGAELNGHIHRLLVRMNADGWLNQRGGIFLLMFDQISQPDRILLDTVARAIIDSACYSLKEEIDKMRPIPSRLPFFVPSNPGKPDTRPTEQVPRPQNLLFDNGLGGFSRDGREYVIYLKDNQWTPAPWTNVIASPGFGCLTTESGLGCSWAANSGENRLTSWRNDPVSDRPSEAIYIRDEETAAFWSPTPLPIRETEPYLVHHGAGYSRYEHRSHGLKQHLNVFVPPDDPLKVIQLKLENTWSRPRRITVTYYAEWVLGVTHEASQQFVIPEYVAEPQALLARDPYNVEFAGRVAFAAANKTLHGLTADRTEFLGRLGSLERPAALARIGLSGEVRPGMDPCAALQLHIDLGPGASEEVYFLLGQAANREESLRLVTAYQQPEKVAQAWQATNASWEQILGDLQVKTPDPAMDLLLNHWLLYQTLSCRIWGRTALYQSSGAYGFRDQLQDVMATIFTYPQQARQHILRAARHQFEAGDVLHWWHPPSGRGIRTRFSDDLLFLPFVVANYIARTGDLSVLDEQVPFVHGDPLEPGEEERYGLYPLTEQSFSIYEHCKRAIKKGKTSGPHGLPLMKSGDWNDGMNRVGNQGRGESVWLAWFLYATLTGFAEVADLHGDPDQARQYRQDAEDLRRDIEASAWDGKWYLRAWYDDGAPLGSAKDLECKIDSIAQSWAVLSQAGSPDRIRQAMQSVHELLVIPDPGLILLFTPPFNKTPHDPGYIKAYIPGIRENGGQYTHAALWSVWAQAMLGDGDRASQYFRLLNPIHHSDNPDRLDRYRVEPYVVAADIYSVQPHLGQGGWTWYTGSSGWMYRLGIEGMLGFTLLGDHFRVDPSIPTDWASYQITYRRGNALYHITVENPHGVQHGIRQVLLDGQEVPNALVPFAPNGNHEVKVILEKE